MDLKKKIDVRINKNLASKIDKIISEMGFNFKEILFVSDEIIWENNQQFFKKISKTNLLIF